MEMKHIISLGAGVQSSTMALMAAIGELTPMPVAAVFADTGDEPAAVYKWLDWLEKQLPFPVVRVSAGVLSLRELRVIRSKRSGNLYRKSGVPFYTVVDGKKGMLPRKCTRDFKIDPITRAQRTLAGVKRGEKQKVVCTWIGISTDEMERMKASHVPFSENRWPLIEAGVSRQQCLDWMKAHGYPQPPRSACVFCPYHSDREWVRLRTENPAEFERAVKFEKDVQAATLTDDVSDGVPFLHASRIPLDKVSFDTTAQQEITFGMNNECEGMCGV